MWVFDKRRIVRHYLRFWFWIDLLSVLPIWILAFALPDTAEEAAASLGDGAGGLGETASAEELLGTIRIVRLLRLLKIMRVLKASRIFKRFEANMEITYASLAQSYHHLLRHHPMAHL